MNYNQRLQKLNSEYADAQVFHDNEETNRICELALDLCEEMQMIPESKWIPCSEKLPEKNIKVLAQNEAEDISLEETDDVINISKGKINWLESYKFGNGLKIIAWMPLPKCYKENVDS